MKERIFLLKAHTWIGQPEGGGGGGGEGIGCIQFGKG